MRDAFVQALCELARCDKNLMLVTGDLGFGVLDRFAREFPKQYLNAGVAEQNMTGVAAGMALEGKIVFTYSIGNFPTLRCLEQIRNDICYHNANVKIVSIGGGFCYGPLGISHHATEDLSIMRSIPNLVVAAPGDLAETALVTEAIYHHHGPCYLRLGRGGEERVHEATPVVGFGKGLKLISDGDVALVSTGGILGNVMKAKTMLQQHGIAASVTSMPFLVPFDRDSVCELASRSRLIVTVEEHLMNGGLGGAVAEVLAEIESPHCPLLRIGIGEGFTCEVGNQDYLREVRGLSPQTIVDRIACHLRKEGR